MEYRQSKLDSTLNRNTLYPLGEYFKGIFRKKEQDRLRAIWTGEFVRYIQPGEWYFSGAIVHAYLATSEVGPYYPAKIVKVTQKISYQIQPLEY